jgi:hypothetical protein
MHEKIETLATSEKLLTHILYVYANCFKRGVYFRWENIRPSQIWKEMREKRCYRPLVEEIFYCASSRVEINRRLKKLIEEQDGANCVARYFLMTMQRELDMTNLEKDLEFAIFREKECKCVSVLTMRKFEPDLLEKVYVEALRECECARMSRDIGPMLPVHLP